MSRLQSPLFVPALASISLVGPLAIHLYFPAIPAAKVALSLSDAQAQFAFSVALFCMSFATLAYGALSDRYGRRPLLLSGLCLFLLGSIVAFAAETFTALVAGRAVQAIGAGCGVTLARTIASDVYGTARLIKAIAYLTMFYTLGSSSSPLVGGILIDAFGWRSVFGFALVVGERDPGQLLCRHTGNTSGGARATTGHAAKLAETVRRRPLRAVCPAGWPQYRHLPGGGNGSIRC